MTEPKILKAGCHFATEGAPGPNVSPYDLRQFLINRYKFFEAPTALEQMLSDEGSSFQFGEFEGNIIRRLTIDPAGISADSVKDTATAEAFLRDVITSLEDALSFHLTPVLTSFDSIVEFTATRDPLLGILRDETFQDSTNAYLESVLAGAGRLQLSKIELNSPIESSERLGQLVLSIERRAGQLYSENLFFSRAPLPTSKHLAMIESMLRTL